MSSRLPEGTHQVSSNITHVQRGALRRRGRRPPQVLSSAQMLSGDSNRPKAEVAEVPLLGSGRLIADLAALEGRLFTRAALIVCMGFSKLGRNLPHPR